MQDNIYCSIIPNIEKKNSKHIKRLNNVKKNNKNKRKNTGRRSVDDHRCNFPRISSDRSKF